VANFHPQKNHLWGGTHGSNLNKLLLEQQRKKKKQEQVRQEKKKTKKKKKTRASETCVEHGMAKPLVSDKETRGRRQRKERKNFKQINK